MANCGLKAYLQRHEETPVDGDGNTLSIDIALENVPKACIRWASYKPDAVGHEPFSAISATMRRSNSTRNASMVRYEVDSRDGSSQMAFAEVLFFYTTKEEQLPKTHYLAYIQEFLVQSDGRLLYQAGLGLKTVIDARSIRELIGLVKNQD